MKERQRKVSKVAATGRKVHCGAPTIRHGKFIHPHKVRHGGICPPVSRWLLLCHALPYLSQNDSRGQLFKLPSMEINEDKRWDG